MSAVIARIALRYLAAAMVTAGYLSPELSDQIGADPDLIMAVGAGIAAGTEGLYAIAKRLGWAT